MKKTLVLLVGETGAGKDTVAGLLPFKQIVSYKTGPMRNTDIDGVTHHFISEEKMDELENAGGLIAWTQTGDIRYCATDNQLTESVMIYVINPDGVRWFKRNYKNDDLNIIVIGLYSSLAERAERCKDRSDFNTVFKKRVAAESHDHTLFRMNGEFDYLINNKHSVTSADTIMHIIMHMAYCTGSSNAPKMLRV